MEKLNDENRYRLFLLNAGVRRDRVIGTVLAHLEIAVETAEILVEDAPGYLRCVSRPQSSKLLQCRCGRVGTRSLTSGDWLQFPPALEDFAFFARERAIEFAADLRAAGASVVVVSPYWSRG
jgi:hypothetical protein